MTTTAPAAPRSWQCPGDHTCRADRGHDTYLGYRYGCRSKAARAAEARYRRGHDRVTTNPVGVVRRLQALAALGWPDHELAARLGCRKQAVQQWRSGRSATVRTPTARKVDQLYIALSDHRGPSDQVRQHALHRGWLLPIWWDDDTIDDPTVVVGPAGMPHRRTPVDKTAVLELTEQGLTADQIAARLGCHRSTVEKIRQGVRQATVEVA